MSPALVLFCLMLAAAQMINAHEVREKQPALYEEDFQQLQWNVERHVWKKSPRLEDGRRVNLWDVKVGATLKAWQAEERPGDEWRLSCGRHVLRTTPKLNAARESGTKKILAQDFPLGASAPTSLCFCNVPILKWVDAFGLNERETVAEFWQRWNATLTHEEWLALRPLSDFVMAKRRVPLNDDSVSCTPSRRTKVSKKKIGLRDDVLAVVSCEAMRLAVMLRIEKPWLSFRTIAQQYGLSVSALRSAFQRATETKSNKINHGDAFCEYVYSDDANKAA